MHSLLSFAPSLVFSDVIWIISVFLSERIRGDMYTVGRLARAHFLLSARSEILASRIQLENALKPIF